MQHSLVVAYAFILMIGHLIISNILEKEVISYRSIKVPVQS